MNFRHISFQCKRWGRLASKIVVKTAIVAVIFLLLCEFAVYPLVLLRCSWPKVNPPVDGNSKENETLRAMFLADTHLLGPFRGHWLDKLRREWQMYRSFQTAMYLFEPEVVFFLGDVFDEGHWVQQQGFDDYVERFKRIFSVKGNGKTRSFVVTGNHDMGFHFEVIQYPILHSRFNKGFNTTSVRMVKLKGSKFLLLNSMAMEMDGCHLCKAALNSLKKISASLKCEENPAACTKKEQRKASSEGNGVYSAPILLQHFPLYRPSDADCIGEDTAPAKDKMLKFKENYDCLSKESSQFLLKSIKPRLILSGHTHHHCVTEHPLGENGNSDRESVVEISVPSFNWRNRNDPSFYMAVITPQENHLSKCYLPRESTVINLYMIGGIVLFLWLFSSVVRSIFSRLSLRFIPSQSYKDDTLRKQ